MAKVTVIPIYCWHCGKRFYIEIADVYAGKLLCSDKCRIDNLKNEIEIEKMREEAKSQWTNN